MIVVETQAQRDESGDVHVMPSATAPLHKASVDCWCVPCIDEGFRMPNAGRLWLHNRRES